MNISGEVKYRTNNQPASFELISGNGTCNNVEISNVGKYYLSSTDTDIIFRSDTNMVIIEPVIGTYIRPMLSELQYTGGPISISNSDFNLTTDTYPKKWEFKSSNPILYGASWIISIDEIINFTAQGVISFNINNLEIGINGLDVTGNFNIVSNTITSDVIDCATFILSNDNSRVEQLVDSTLLFQVNNDMKFKSDTSRIENLIIEDKLILGSDPYTIEFGKDHTIFNTRLMSGAESFYTGWVVCAHTFIPIGETTTFYLPPNGRFEASDRKDVWSHLYCYVDGEIEDATLSVSVTNGAQNPDYNNSDRILRSNSLSIMNFYVKDWNDVILEIDEPVASIIYITTYNVQLNPHTDTLQFD